MFRLNVVAQRLLCDAVSPRKPWPDALGRFLKSVPAPRNRAEDLLLRSILARVVVVISHQEGPSGTRSRAMAQSVASILVDESVTPQEAFATWGQRRSGRSGIVKNVDLARLIVRRSTLGPVDLQALTEEFGVSERGVREAFRRAYGMPPRTYKRRTKVLCAIELLRKESWDNETVARELGFRSPKNFYRALRLDTGLTPRQIRGLSEADVQVLRSRIAPEASASHPIVAPTGGSEGSRLTARAGSAEGRAHRRKAG